MQKRCKHLESVPIQLITYFTVFYLSSITFLLRISYQIERSISENASTCELILKNRATPKYYTLLTAINTELTFKLNLKSQFP